MVPADKQGGLLLAVCITSAVNIVDIDRSFRLINDKLDEDESESIQYVWDCVHRQWDQSRNQTMAVMARNSIGSLQPVWSQLQVQKCQCQNQ